MIVWILVRTIVDVEYVGQVLGIMTEKVVGDVCG